MGKKGRKRHTSSRVGAGFGALFLVVKCGKATLHHLSLLLFMFFLFSCFYFSFTFFFLPYLFRKPFQLSFFFLSFFLILLLSCIEYVATFLFILFVLFVSFIFFIRREETPTHPPQL